MIFASVAGKGLTRFFVLGERLEIWRKAHRKRHPNHKPIVSQEARSRQAKSNDKKWRRECGRGGVAMHEEFAGNVDDADGADECEEAPPLMGLVGYTARAVKKLRHKSRGIVLVRPALEICLPRRVLCSGSATKPIRSHRGRNNKRENYSDNSLTGIPPVRRDSEKGSGALSQKKREPSTGVQAR